MVRLAQILTTLAILAAAVAIYAEAKETSDKTKLPALQPADDTLVRSLVSDFAATWNAHDMEGMHALDSEDVQWVNVAGNIWRGKAEVIKGHRAIHRTIYAKTSMSVESVDVRPISPDVAIAVARMKFGAGKLPNGQEIPPLESRGSFIAAKRNGTWKIVHFQNTTIDPEKEKNDPLTWSEGLDE